MMPKRVVDGEALWRSDKIGSLPELWMRAEFANLLPLALADGTFECAPRMIWSQVYSCNRPDVSPEMVEHLLSEYERVKLLFRWRDATGKTWGYWVNIDKPGRLPGESRKKSKHEKRGAEVPRQTLAEFLTGTRPMDAHSPSSKQPVIDHAPTNGDIGSGSGSGKGKGKGKGKGNGSGENPADDEKGEIGSSNSTHIPEETEVRGKAESESSGTEAVQESLPTSTVPAPDTRDIITLTNQNENQQQSQSPAAMLFTACVEALSEYWKRENPGIDFCFCKRAGRNLKEFLKQNRSMTLDKFKLCLENRSRSQVNQADDIWRWIYSLRRFVSGPLDKYGHPLKKNSVPQYQPENMQYGKTEEPTWAR